MSEITAEMLAAGCAAFEVYAGGNYVKWRQAVVQAWVAMNQAKAGQAPDGGDTFKLAYSRNLAKAKELDESVERAATEHARRVAAAKEHGFSVPIDTDPAAQEREWQAWFAANS